MLYFLSFRRTMLKRGAFKVTSSIINCLSNRAGKLKRNVTDSADTNACPGSPSVSTTEKPFNSSVLIKDKSNEEIITGRPKCACNRWVITSLICCALNARKNNTHTIVPAKISNMEESKNKRSPKRNMDLLNLPEKRKKRSHLSFLLVIVKAY